MNKNPYKEGSEEAMNWEAGFAASIQTDCPYEKDDSEFKKFYTAWMKGFKSKGTKETLLQTTPLTLDSINTKDLEAELMKRKRAELDKLLKQKEEIDKKVTKLQLLFGE